MSKGRFPKEVLRFFNSPCPTEKPKTSYYPAYTPKVYWINGKPHRIPAKAVIDKRSNKKYVPAY